MSNRTSTTDDSFLQPLVRETTFKNRNPKFCKVFTGLVIATLLFLAAAGVLTMQFTIGFQHFAHLITYCFEWSLFSI